MKIKHTLILMALMAIVSVGADAQRFSYRVHDDDWGAYGSDDDFMIKFDSSDVRLEWDDADSNTIMTLTDQGTTGDLGVTGKVDIAGILETGSGNHSLTNAAGLIDGGKIQSGTVDTAQLALDAVDATILDETASFTMVNLTATGLIAVTGEIDVGGIIETGSGNHELTNAAGLIDGLKIQPGTVDSTIIDATDSYIIDGLQMGDDLIFTGQVDNVYDIMTATSDGSDDESIRINPAGAFGPSRGAGIALSGNEAGAGSAGRVFIDAGNFFSSGQDGSIEFRTGASAERMNIPFTGDITVAVGFDIEGLMSVGQKTETGTDTTPSVADASIITLNLSGATTITDFDNEIIGQVLFVRSTDSDPTIEHGATIVLDGGVDYEMTADDTLILVNVGGVWYEHGRNGASGGGGGSGDTITSTGSVFADPDSDGNGTESFEVLFDGGAIPMFEVREPSGDLYLGIDATDVLITGDDEGDADAGATDGDIIMATDGNLSFIVDADEDQAGAFTIFEGDGTTEMLSSHEGGLLRATGNIQTLSGIVLGAAAPSGDLTLSSVDNVTVRIDNANANVSLFTVAAGGGPTTVMTVDELGNLLMLSDVTAEGGDYFGTVGGDTSVQSDGDVTVELDNNTGETSSFIVVDDGGTPIVTATEGGDFLIADTLTVTGQVTLSSGFVDGHPTSDFQFNAGANFLMDLDANDDGGNNTFGIRDSDLTTVFTVDEAGVTDTLTGYEINGTALASTDLSDTAEIIRTTDTDTVTSTIILDATVDTIDLAADAVDATILDETDDYLVNSLSTTLDLTALGGDLFGTVDGTTTGNADTDFIIAIDVDGGGTNSFFLHNDGGSTPIFEVREPNGDLHLGINDTNVFIYGDNEADGSSDDGDIIFQTDGDFRFDMDTDDDYGFQRFIILDGDGITMFVVQENSDAFLLTDKNFVVELDNDANDVNMSLQIIDGLGATAHEFSELGGYNGLRFRITPIGGYAILMADNTTSSIIGQVVIVDAAADDQVEDAGNNETEQLGIIESVSGSNVWVVVNGIADVAFEDNTATTAGDHAITSVTEGPYCINSATASATRNIGHIIESVAAGGGGTHILARVVLKTTP